MASSKMAFCLLMLSLAFFVQMANGANLFKFCPANSGNFTSNSAYKRNLNKLLGEFNLKTRVTGFSLGSAGQSPDRVVGLSQCRADVSRADCASCILEATRDIRSFCKNTKNAMIWYDNCFLSYSDTEFSGAVDSHDGAIQPNFDSPNDPDSFLERARTLLSDLSEKASVSTKLFAAGETKAGKSEKIFGLVDCTRDLSSFRCKFCLDILVNAIKNDTNIIGTRNGGRIIAATCDIRYEVFSFFNA